MAAPFYAAARLRDGPGAALPTLRRYRCGTRSVALLSVLLEGAYSRPRRLRSLAWECRYDAMSRHGLFSSFMTMTHLASALGSMLDLPPRRFFGVHGGGRTSTAANMAL